MQLRTLASRTLKGLGPIFLVAIAVALGTTLVSSAFAQIRQVDAEDLTTAETLATPGPADQQTVMIASWDVQFTLPLAIQSTRLSYADQAGASVGLSSADLEKLGPNCRASQSALGSLIRYPHGEYAASTHGTSINYFIGTVGAYDYGYELPSGLCANAAAAGSIINRETSVINMSLSSLAPIGN